MLKWSTHPLVYSTPPLTTHGIATHKKSLSARALITASYYVNPQSERINNTVTVSMFFQQYFMLSHRWEGKEPLLHDIRGKNVYELPPAK